MLFSARVNTDEEYGQIRLDHVFSPGQRSSLFARFTADDTTKPSPASFPTIDINWATVNNFSTISETHIFSPPVVNTGRATFSHTGLNYTDSTNEKGPGLSYGNPNVYVGNVIVTGLTTYNTSVVPMWNKQNTYTLGDDLNWTKGRHSLKFGTLFNRIDNPQQSNFFQNGIAVFANLNFFLKGLPLTYQVSTVDPGIAQNRNYQYYTAGFYAGDDLPCKSKADVESGIALRIFHGSRVNLNNRDFSMRNIVQGTPVLCTTPGAPNCVTQGPEFQNPSLKNFSPRFGFAWDVTGKEPHSIRGGGNHLRYRVRSITYISGVRWERRRLRASAVWGHAFPSAPRRASPCR